MTESGPVIRAGAAVFATNSPVNDRDAIHSKQVPSRPYAIAGRVPKGSEPDALVWDTHEAYHYVRLQPLDDPEDLLLVGGEDHRSGRSEEHTSALQSLMRRSYAVVCLTKKKLH